MWFKWFKRKPPKARNSFGSDEDLKDVTWVTAEEFEAQARAAGLNSRAINALRADSEFLRKPANIRGKRLAIGHPFGV